MAFCHTQRNSLRPCVAQVLDVAVQEEAVTPAEVDGTALEVGGNRGHDALGSRQAASDRTRQRVEISSACGLLQTLDSTTPAC